jgi:hypothetical protein
MQTIRRHCAYSAVLLAAALAATAAGAAEPAQGRVIQQELEYADLARYVGKTVTIRSKFNTTRTGELIKYTDNGLIIKLPAREGGMELNMPRNTVVKVSAPIPVDEPFFTEPEADGAKKD